MNPSASAVVRWRLMASLPLWIAGFVLAIWAWSLQRDAPDCSDAAAHCRSMSTDAQIAEEYGLQRMGGKAMVFMVRFERWAATWLEGARLRALLSAACFVSAFALVGWAFHRGEPEDDESPDRSHERIP